jgi:hypothetical protein
MVAQSRMGLEQVMSRSYGKEPAMVGWQAEPGCSKEGIYTGEGMPVAMEGWLHVERLIKHINILMMMGATLIIIRNVLKYGK